MSSRKTKKRASEERDERLDQLIRVPPNEEYDPEAEFAEKKQTLLDMVKSSQNIVMITGAGISTAANIPDYRGVEGLYTKDVEQFDRTFDIRTVVPTKTHMIIKELMIGNYVKHLISQNCDGLHLRSGIPQKLLSEIHGNMYIEYCRHCDKQYIRPFEVSFYSDFRQHETDRKCSSCKYNLTDTIVHAGEKSTAKWPQNWDAALEAMKVTDLIIILGTSGVVLKNYDSLWPKNAKKILINTQPTMIDDRVDLKIRAKCDDVMTSLFEGLQLQSSLMFCTDCDLVLNQGRRPQYLKLMHDFNFCTCHVLAPKTKLILDDSMANLGCPGWLKHGLKRMRKLYVEDASRDDASGEESSDESSDYDYEPDLNQMASTSLKQAYKRKSSRQKSSDDNETEQKTNDHKKKYAENGGKNEKKMRQNIFSPTDKTIRGNDGRSDSSDSDSDGKHQSSHSKFQMRRRLKTNRAACGNGMSAVPNQQGQELVDTEGRYQRPESGPLLPQDMHQRSAIFECIREAAEHDSDATIEAIETDVEEHIETNKPAENEEVDSDATVPINDISAHFEDLSEDEPYSPSSPTFLEGAQANGFLFPPSPARPPGYSPQSPRSEDKIILEQQLSNAGSTRPANQPVRLYNDLLRDWETDTESAKSENNDTPIANKEGEELSNKEEKAEEAVSSNQREQAQNVVLPNQEVMQIVQAHVAPVSSTLNLNGHQPEIVQATNVTSDQTLVRRPSCCRRVFPIPSKEQLDERLKNWFPSLKECATNNSLVPDKTNCNGMRLELAQSSLNSFMNGLNCQLAGAISGISNVAPSALSNIRQEGNEYLNKNNKKSESPQLPDSTESPESQPTTSSRSNRTALPASSTLSIDLKANNIQMCEQSVLTFLQKNMPLSSGILKSGARRRINLQDHNVPCKKTTQLMAMDKKTTDNYSTVTIGQNNQQVPIVMAIRRHQDEKVEGVHLAKRARLESEEATDPDEEIDVVGFSNDDNHIERARNDGVDPEFDENFLEGDDDEEAPLVANPPPAQPTVDRSFNMEIGDEMPEQILEPSPERYEDQPSTSTGYRGPAQIDQMSASRQEMLFQYEQSLKQNAQKSKPAYHRKASKRTSNTSIDEEMRQFTTCHAEAMRGQKFSRYGGGGGHSSAFSGGAMMMQGAAQTVGQTSNASSQESIDETIESIVRMCRQPKRPTYQPLPLLPPLPPLPPPPPPATMPPAPMPPKTRVYFTVQKKKKLERVDDIPYVPPAHREIQVNFDEVMGLIYTSYAHLMNVTEEEFIRFRQMFIDRLGHSTGMLHLSQIRNMLQAFKLDHCQRRQ